MVAGNIKVGNCTTAISTEPNLLSRFTVHGSKYACLPGQDCCSAVKFAYHCTCQLGVTLQ